MTVQGSCHPSYEPLRELLAARLAARLADGSEAGASVAVVHDGELVADLWGGAARPGEPWREGTIVQVWSVTKTMAALTVLVLVDRGELDLDAPVASYWPEFKRGDVLVRHLLAHTDRPTTTGTAGRESASPPDLRADTVVEEGALACLETPATGSGLRVRWCWSPRG